MSSPIQQYEQLRTSYEFVFLVYYRGHWCPFCQHYLKSFVTVGPSIKAAGGEPVIVTAEGSPEYLEEVRNKTNYKRTAIIDPENELAAKLRRERILDVAISPKSGYAKGMAQPAVLVIDKDEKVLFSWAVEPGMGNLGGAKDRPSLEEIWEDVNAQMSGQPLVHNGQYRKQTFLQGISTKIFG